MADKSFFHGAIVALTTAGICLPQGLLLAADSPVAPKQASVTKVVASADVRLSSGGTLSGRVVDHTGNALEGAEVVVRQGKAEVARAVTDDSGLWVVKNLSNGVYQASSGATTGQFRVWGETAAPPAAKDHALLVMGENGARGQFGSYDPALWLIGGLAVTGVALGGVALSQSNDSETTIIYQTPSI